MKKNILILILTSFLCTQSNHIYLELLGPGLVGSVNYEKSINDKLFVRGGIGIPLKVSESSFSGTSEIKVTPIIFGFNYLRGNNFKFDASAGVSLWMIDFKGSTPQDIGGLEFDSEGSYPLLYTSFGFRYQKPAGGITLKAGLSATNIVVEETSGMIPAIYFGGGYSF
tara:strand:- start:45 stop:548 length:504 start_codon:yes stop_codon:yes gene_type:complete